MANTHRTSARVRSSDVNNEGELHADSPGAPGLHEAALRYKEEFPAANAEAIEVNLEILRTQRVMTTAIARYIYAQDLANSLSGARYNLLRTLYFSKDQRLAQNEIGKAMGVSRTNITNLIDGLERDGLVVRVANPADRRVSYAQLTSHGESLLKELMPAMVQFMEVSCEDFSLEEKVQFAGFLARFRRGLEERFLEDYASEALSEASV